MSTSREDLKTLLLQVRHLEQVRREEHQSFARYSGLRPDQVDVLNVFDRPLFGPEALDGYDALFVGGASEASVLEPERFPFLQESQDLLRHCAESGFPVFASCFGFQLAVLALGGTITSDERYFELGTLPVLLTPAAKDDPLLRDTPNGFRAVIGHNQQALEAPPGCELLAETDLTTQGFRVDGRPFWAFQFHPELNRATLKERLGLYRDHYLESDEEFQKLLGSIVETPEANALLAKFVDRVLL